MRQIKPLTEENQKKLYEIYRNHKQHQVRERAHAIILSAEKGFCIGSLAKIFDVDRDTISRWFDRWEVYAFEGLFDAKKSGRKRILSTEEEIEAIKIVNENPTQLKPALIKIKEETGKEISNKTLKRCLKRNNYIWKRVRKGVKKNEIQRSSKKCKNY